MAENNNTSDSSGSTRPKEYEREYYDQAAQTTAGYHAMFYEKLFPEMGGAEKFSLFMCSDEIIELVESHQVTCLADALAQWLIHGSATLVCPTYESYLRVVLHIIECWLGEGGWASNNYECSYGRTPPQTDCDWVYDEETGIARSQQSTSGRHYIVLPTLVRAGTHVQIWCHPALSREAFEYARHRRRLIGDKQDPYEFELDD